MIVRENRALSECIGDRCKRTGIGEVLRIVKQTRFSDNSLLAYPLLFFCYEPLCTSLRGFRGQLFMERFNQKNSPGPHLIRIRTLPPVWLPCLFLRRCDARWLTGNRHCPPVQVQTYRLRFLKPPLRQEQK
jgi:hypothetical protein